MNAERAAELVKLIDQLDPDTVDFRSYATCLLGRAAAYKPFYEQGLHRVQRGGSPIVAYKWHTCLEAGCWFFDITRTQAQRWFLGTHSLETRREIIIDALSIHR